MLLYMKIRMLKHNIILLWDFGGRPYDIDRSNYVVTDYHTEFMQMIIALELAYLSISDNPLTFDDSYSLLLSDVTYQSTNYLYYFGSPQRTFTN